MALVGIAGTAPLGAQTRDAPSSMRQELVPGAHVRVWASFHNVRAMEGRVVERWGDTIVVNFLEVTMSGERQMYTLVLPFADAEHLEVWAKRPGIRKEHAVRLGYGLGGVAVLATVVSENPYAIGAAVAGGVMAVLFLAVGTDNLPDYQWVEVQVTT